MHTYYFDMKDGVPVRDRAGRELVSDGAAIALSKRLADEVRKGNPVGNLSAPLFGQTLSVGGGPFASASANRRIDLQARFSF